MASTYVPQGTTTRLTPADEQSSANSSQKNLEQQAFQEWPNEAGVSDHLPSPFKAPAESSSSLTA
jgi:hypothetical protein